MIHSLDLRLFFLLLLVLLESFTDLLFLLVDLLGLFEEFLGVDTRPDRSATHPGPGITTQRIHELILDRHAETLDL